MSGGGGQQAPQVAGRTEWVPPMWCRCRSATMRREVCRYSVRGCSRRTECTEMHGRGTTDSTGEGVRAGIRRSEMTEERGGGSREREGARVQGAVRDRWWTEGRAGSSTAVQQRGGRREEASASCAPLVDAVHRTLSPRVQTARRRRRCRDGAQAVAAALQPQRSLARSLPFSPKFTHFTPVSGSVLAFCSNVLCHFESSAWAVDWVGAVADFIVEVILVAMASLVCLWFYGLYCCLLACCHSCGSGLRSMPASSLLFSSRVFCLFLACPLDLVHYAVSLYRRRNPVCSGSRSASAGDGVVRGREGEGERMSG